MALTAAISALALVIALTLRDHKLLGPGGTGAAVMMWVAGPSAITDQAQVVWLVGREDSLVHCGTVHVGDRVWHGKARHLALNTSHG